MDQSWPFPTKPLLFSWPVSPGRKPSLPSLQSIRWAASVSEEKRELGPHCSVWRLPPGTSLFSLLHITCLSTVPACPQIQISPGSTSLGYRLSFLPQTSGICLWSCVPPARSPFFHPASGPRLPRRPVHPIPKLFQTWAVQTARVLLTLPLQAYISFLL